MTAEILQDIGYEDQECREILRVGSTLAGDVPAIPVFQDAFRPGLMTLSQLEESSSSLNQVVLAQTSSSGDPDLDCKLWRETELEIEKGWAEGPFDVTSLEQGATVSKRFPLSQGDKTRMIDDFTVSGVNDSVGSSSKVDLHLVDTFAALVRKYFAKSREHGSDSALVAKTYDLKSAYRQIPIREDHLKFAYFAVFNHVLQQVQIYRLRTLPFGAVHSVCSFLRLARMLFTIAARALFLLNTSYYDDFILGSKPGLVSSSQNAMELVFMITNSEYARDGKKSTSFGTLCKALGVEFNLSRASEQLMMIQNTEKRVEELVRLIGDVLSSGLLSKTGALTLRGKLGFADSFLHGRLGNIALKLLSEHASSKHSQVGMELRLALQAMSLRLSCDKPRQVTARPLQQWYVYTDACYDKESRSGGVGGVLVDHEATCRAWFSRRLTADECKIFGSGVQDTIIYELELLGAIMAMHCWKDTLCGDLSVLFVDNEGVKHALIRGSATGRCAKLLIEFNLSVEAEFSSQTWFARVPTEANIADWPSRSSGHPLLLSSKECSDKAASTFDAIVAFMESRRECSLG